MKKLVNYPVSIALAVSIVIALLLAACSSSSNTTATTQAAGTTMQGVTTTSQGNQMPNPASTYCVQHNYKLEIRTDATGGQYGVCVFPDRTECEEWKFFRHECNYTGTIAPTMPVTTVTTIIGRGDGQTACTGDADCVPAECCHPRSCMNKAYKKPCNLFCTEECSPGTLDCQQGSCRCVSGSCKAVING